MCARYFIDSGLEERVLSTIASEQNGFSFGNPRDCFPSEEAVVISAGLKLEKMRWGFPDPSGKKLIINSRSESAAEKTMFADSLLRRRLVIPASGFYEWNRNKEKAVFRRHNNLPTYMLGLFDIFSDEPRFVILTTAANESMLPVHDRMPCIIDEDKIGGWLENRTDTRKYLEAEPPRLIREMEYEQLSLDLS